MKKILIVFALAVLALCICLYVKNNPVPESQKAEGTFAYERGKDFEYIKQRV